MIFDTCKCGAEFRVGYNGLHAATDERVAHSEWLAAHASCRVVAQEQEHEIATVSQLNESLDCEWRKLGYRPYE